MLMPEMAGKGSLPGAGSKVNGYSAESGIRAPLDPR